jgi:UDPglucose 6-dehydrogenase
MKISVMGIDYNQLLSGKVLAEMGNEVTYVSKDNKRVENIKRGFYNADEAMVIKSIGSNSSIGFTSNMKEALSTSNMCFISEGYKEENEEDMEHVLKLAKDVGANMSHDMFIIDRSGISHSRVEEIKETIQAELEKRNARYSFEIIANPNFLRA